MPLSTPPATSHDARPIGAIIGERLRERRLAAGLRQEEVANEAGLDRATIAAIELGRRSDPRLDDVIAHCGALRVQLAELLGERGNHTWVARNNGRPIRLDLYAQLLGGPTSSALKAWWRILEREAQERVSVAAETKAARRFGVGVDVLTAAALSRWGHSLTEERDRRVDQSAGSVGVPARRLQALRSVATRELLAELEPELAKPRPKMKRGH